MPPSNRHLLVLGCSETKLHNAEALPAIQRYDGTPYRVVKKFLRESEWPSSLSIAVLSARYGLIGGLTPINYYDQRMDKSRAAELKTPNTETLIKWGLAHKTVSLVLGKDYLSSVNLDQLSCHGISPTVVPGQIGEKLHGLKDLLQGFGSAPRMAAPAALGRPYYFLPDWDDMLDTTFDFKGDRFSAAEKSGRGEQHCIQIMQPQRMCDGVLVSLAQHLSSFGVLRRFNPTDVQALAPKSIRSRFALTADQWVFGDCGAFTYVNEPRPTLTIEQALSLYQLYGFDFGASIDHIPVTQIKTDEGNRQLTDAERQARVALTHDNAAAFLDLHRQRKCTFKPVGVIQGITAQDYARQLPEYAQMGYTHVAIGGLVPRSDASILEVMREVSAAKKQHRLNVWIHLFGIFRPGIHHELRQLGLTSFDSATYFRKAWLRSGQNYLGTDGRWYAAIRVPMTSDPRTRIRLASANVPLERLKCLEQETLQALHDYEAHRTSLDSVLEAVAAYDFLLSRGEDHGQNLLGAYRATLEARPWEQCQCQACRSAGIDVLIFRGSNRNKRRGAHNTLMLYGIVSKECKITDAATEILIT